MQVHNLIKRENSEKKNRNRYLEVIKCDLKYPEISNTVITVTHMIIQIRDSFPRNNTHFRETHYHNNTGNKARCYLHLPSSRPLFTKKLCTRTECYEAIQLQDSCTETIPCAYHLQHGSVVMMMMSNFLKHPAVAECCASFTEM